MRKVRNKTIEEILERALPSATRQQMEAAGDRVAARLRAERQRGAVSIQQRDVRARIWWRPVVATAAVTALFALVVSLGIPPRDQGLYAVLEAADGSMYRISNGNRVPVRVGDRIAAQETLRSNGGGGAVLALADGSRIEIGSTSEMWWDRADDGLMVRLNTGSIIVNAAKESTGRLYVQTKDATVEVAGTALLANAGTIGSRVAVIEGEARVRGGAAEIRRAVGEDINWSRNADAYRTILAVFEKNMATTAGTLTPLNKTAASQGDPGQRAAAAGPAFEEASIRLCDPDALPATPAGGRAGGSGSLQMTPGRLNALCMRVDTLIGEAYGVGPRELPIPIGPVAGLGNAAARQVRGGPDWIRTDRYTIEAVTTGSADGRTMSGPMLRDLFARRFRLAARIESEPAPAYVLTVAPGGLRIEPVDADGCIKGTSASGFLVPPDVRAAVDLIHRGEKPYCGLLITNAGEDTVIIGGARPLRQLVEHGLLRDVLGERVIDRTGIPPDALFNFALAFASDDTTRGPVGRFGRGRPPTDAAGAPNIVTAFREQLGLQLEAAQAPRDYVVIESIERPSEN